MNDFKANPDYVTYEKLLIELHRLIAEGRGDDEEADVVREAMDAPWYKLSHAESDHADGLSADLYMLQGEEIYEAYEGTQEELREALNSAHRRGDSREVLRLLRNGPNFIPSYGIASLRAAAYQELGHLEVALIFLRYALSEVQEPEFRIHWEPLQIQVMSLLVRLQRYQEAVAEIEASIDHLTFPDVRFVAAHLLALCAEHMLPENASSLYQRAGTTIESILNDPGERERIPGSLIPLAFQVLGECYRNSGQPQKAEIAYNNAIRTESDTILQVSPQRQIDFLSLPVAA